MRFKYTTKNLQKFQKFKAFKRVLLLDFCAENLSHFLKYFSKHSNFHFLFPLTNKSFNPTHCSTRIFVREESFAKESLWSFDYQENLVLEIVELGIPV